MGEVMEKITLINESDMTRVKDGSIDEKDVRRMEVSALVDTGSMRLVIGPETCQSLGLDIRREGVATLTGGGQEKCQLTSPVTVCWKDRSSTIQAMVLPGQKEILLGVIPLEDMDLRVNPVECCLEGIHGDDWVHYVRVST